MTEAEPTGTWEKEKREQRRAMTWAGQETSVSIIAQGPHHSVAHKCMSRARKMDAIQAGSCRETCLNPLHHTFLHQALRNRASAGHILERKRLK